jgi:DNA (cytosine-5)-methyltransferase 1
MNGGIFMNGLALCAGIGGIELGLSLAATGYRTVGFVERDPFAADTLFALMKDGIFEKAEIWSDVRRFDPRELRGHLDIISSGFPCQPWSVAGKQRGIKDERWLWPEIAEIIHQLSPRYVFLENVVGLLNTGLGHVLRDLAQNGYDAEWDVFSAEQCGAPHLRERLFILAYRAGVDGTWLHHERDSAGKSEEEAGNRRCNVGNPDRSRLQGRRGCKPQDENELPAWPPGPEEFDRWQRVLAIDPTVEPAICGMADGIPPELERSLGPNRQNRLRALGNAVVPVVAAVAFVTLMRRANSQSR